jgi:tellurium resistance protein TerZ
MSISLSKGQRISLAKERPQGLSRAHMGLGWDALPVRGWFGKSKEQAIDLDASCLVFDATGTQIDQVWWKQLRSSDGAIQHTGDNTTGAGDGDDESIIVDLPALRPDAATLVFVVNSYSGENFNQIENAFCRLVDAASGVEIARYDLSGSGTHTAQIMAKLVKIDGDWHMEALGVITNGKTIKDLGQAVRSVL